MASTCKAIGLTGVTPKSVLLLILQLSTCIQAVTSTTQTDTVSTDLPWLNGFGKCNNVVIFLAGIYLQPVTIIPEGSALLFTPYILYMPQIDINHTVANYGRWTICQTISFLFDLEKEAVATNQLLTANILSLKYFYRHGVASWHALSPEYMLSKEKSVRNLPLALLSHSLFLVMPHSPKYFKRIGLDVLHFLSFHPFHQKPFRLCYPRVPKYEIDKLPFFEMGNELVDAVFICRGCVHSTTLSTDYPFKEYAVNCLLAVNCRQAMGQVYMEATGDGKKLAYYFWERELLVEIKEKLERVWNSKTVWEVLQVEPVFEHVIYLTLTSGMPQMTGMTNLSHNETHWIGFEDVLSFDANMVPLESISYNFLTCDSSEVSTDFGVYQKPFKWHVWAMILFTICVTIVVCARLRKFRTGFQTDAFGVFMSLSCLLLNNPDERIEKHFCNKGILTSWLLGSVILTTAYQGNNFASFIAPNEFYKTFTQIVELQNFTLFAATSTFTEPTNLNDPFYTEFGHGLISWIRSRVDPDWYSEFRMNWTNKGLFNSHNFNDSLTASIASLFPNIQLVRSQDGRVDLEASQIVGLLQNCSKTAYVSKSIKAEGSLANIRARFKGKTKKPVYSGGPDTLFTKHYYLYSSLSAGNYLMIRMEQLVSSGIYHFWQDQFVEGFRITGRRTWDNVDEQVPLSLNSNFVTTFYILCLCLGCCLMAFLLETLLFGC
ncbi:unnamed protein product [Orchesella dallaii]|uniref:Uncharacterized protein n=1 Tax=Orchesella dallaii TaxID=48710 RepID=A0ABP1QRT9_9HEXA